MYRVLIVEDESDVAQQIKGLVERYAEERGLQFDLQVLSAAFEALSLEESYDICLLDIELPGINGMEAAEILRLNSRARSIIFITNLAQYAVRGYEVEAAGFVIKPASYSALALPLDRAVRALKAKDAASITVCSGGEAAQIELASIEYLEASRHGICLHLSSGEVRFSPQALAQIPGVYPDGPLLRVSRSQLANMDKVSGVTGNDVVMASGARLVIPKGKKKDLLETLAVYLGSKR